MHDYECNARMRPVDIIRAETSWAARKQYAERHGVAVSDCIARRRDMPDSWKPYINETP